MIWPRCWAIPMSGFPKQCKKKLIGVYSDLAQSDRGASFWWGMVQRLVQALGAFGRLRKLPGCARFADYIPPGLRMLRRALDHVGELDNLTKLTERIMSLQSKTEP